MIRTQQINHVLQGGICTGDTVDRTDSGLKETWRRLKKINLQWLVCLY